MQRSGKVLDRFGLDGKVAVVTGGSRELRRAIGLVIMRFGATGSYIIPGDRVAARIADLRLGKPHSGFPTPSAHPAAAAPSPR
jgi:NAD(P)-dependent dehydrogenase (short-subunit alcohol dehydrogenase family)